MGLLDWLFGGASKRRNFLAGDSSYDFEIVGESFYQDTLLRIVGQKAEEEAQHECIAELVQDDRNPHDSKAVAVYINGQKVGHLSRDDAKEYRRFMAHTGLHNAECAAVIMGGWKRMDGDEGSFGVRLDLEWPPRLE